MILVKQIARQLDRSGFCSINIIGIPGSGKSVTANMIVHLLHELKPEVEIRWAGSNELRHIKEYISELPKGRVIGIIFDDTSNALDSLTGEELSEAFLAYTRARHETEGKLLSIMIHHYTKSSRKNFRSQSIFNIYLSSTSTEKGNVRELIRGDQSATNRFKQFQKHYRTSFAEKYFELDLGNGMIAKYEDSKPFRISYVMSPMGANLMVTKEIKCAHCEEPKNIRNYISPDDLLSPPGITEKGKDYYLKALGIMCWLKGYRDGISNDLRRTMDFYNRMLKDGTTDWAQVAEKVRIARGEKKRYYRERKKEDVMYNQMRKKFVQIRVYPVEESILAGLNMLSGPDPIFSEDTANIDLDENPKDMPDDGLENSSNSSQSP